MSLSSVHRGIALEPNASGANGLRLVWVSKFGLQSVNRAEASEHLRKNNTGLTVAGLRFVNSIDWVDKTNSYNNKQTIYLIDP